MNLSHELKNYGVDHMQLVNEYVPYIVRMNIFFIFQKLVCFSIYHNMYIFVYDAQNHLRKVILLL